MDGCERILLYIAYRKISAKTRKKVLTKGLRGVNIIKLSREAAPPEGGGQKNLKKVLDKECSMRYNK